MKTSFLGSAFLLLFGIVIIRGDVATTNVQDFACPRGIKRIGAYPAKGIPDSGYFYQCHGDKPATLERCDRGEYYGIEKQDCIPRQRTKRNHENNGNGTSFWTIFSNGHQHWSSSRNERQLARETRGSDGGSPREMHKQPVLGRAIVLGSLYNARNDEFSTETLWNLETTLKTRTIKQSLQSSDTMVTIEEDFLSQASLLDVEAEMKLSFMAGKIKVSGAAAYLNDEKSTQNSVRVTLSYRATTEYEYIPISLFPDFPSLCFQKKNPATHVVNSVTRGFNGVFVFTKITKDVYEKKRIAGELEVVINVVPSREITGSASITWSEEQRNISSQMTAKFYGDTILPSSPTNFKECVDVYRSLAGIAQNSREIVQYSLTPLSKFCKQHVPINSKSRPS